MPSSTLKVGDRTVTAVVDMAGRLLPARDLYGAEGANGRRLTETGGDFYDEATETLVVAVQGFVILGGPHVILVDTGVGAGKPRRRPNFDDRRSDFVQRVGEVAGGIDRVGLVANTHLHVDHVGGNTTAVEGRWQPSFPNARYLVAADEYEFWTSEAARPHWVRNGDYLSDSVIPLDHAGRLDLVEDGFALDDGVRMDAYPGHTPGHLCVVIESAGERLVIAGDLFHHPLQCRNCHLNTAFCIDPVEAARSRCRFLEAYANTATVVWPAHLSPGRISGNGDRFAFSPVLARYFGDEAPGNDPP